jgi:hypothetical protein
VAQGERFAPDTYPTPCGTARVPQVVSVRPSLMVGRYLSERRTGCAKERPSGSEEGAVSNHDPYSDRQSRSSWAWHVVGDRKAPNAQEAGKGGSE